MAEYEGFAGKKCYKSDIIRIIDNILKALEARGKAQPYKPKPDQMMFASVIEHYRGLIDQTLNYSSFIGQVTSGMRIDRIHIEGLSQAASDLKNLLRCRSGCTGNCHTSCTGACTSSCSGSSHHSGSCSYMTWFCSGDCNNSCSGGCSGSCEGTCGQGCNNYCVSSCKHSSISSTNRAPGTMVSV